MFSARKIRASSVSGAGVRGQLGSFARDDIACPGEDQLDFNVILLLVQNFSNRFLGSIIDNRRFSATINRLID